MGKIVEKSKRLGDIISSLMTLQISIQWKSELKVEDWPNNSERVE